MELSTCVILFADASRTYLQGGLATLGLDENRRRLKRFTARVLAVCFRHRSSSVPCHA
jgi:hypothetical protein